MSDITERLRRLYRDYGTNYVQEAAEEIEALRAEVEALTHDISQYATRDTERLAEVAKLREALRNIAIDKRQETVVTRVMQDCYLCMESWAHGEPERHAPGCLAAPKETT